MDNATALRDLNHALAEYRERQNRSPMPHSAREIAQMSVFAEYLHDAHAQPPAKIDEPPLLLTAQSAA